MSNDRSSEGSRLWFIVGSGLAVFLVELLRFCARRPPVERRAGPFPPPPAVLYWIIALVILMTRIGQLPKGWLLVRGVGFVLSLYAVVMLPWAIRTLGRSYVPGAGVLEDHALVISGPFALVQHPIYSALLALWLGAGFGTLNWIFLAICPLLVGGLQRQAKVEEALLRAKFDGAYANYISQTPRLIPRLWAANPKTAKQSLLNSGYNLTQRR